MKNRFIRMAVFGLLFMLSPFIHADNVLMVRIHMPFEYAMDEVQTLLQDYDYAVAHTQRCDGGLTDFGYKSDFYRIIFFGKIDEVRKLSEKYPEIVPFLPLKLLLFAEKDETLLVAFNPETLINYFDDAELQIQLKRWRNDLVSLFNEMRDKRHVLPEINPIEKTNESDELQ